ncbi:hypothetical protein AYI68_g3424 [Smittium mucronatum]|uniref:Uncharacterized protein n=1 Tax=Smittium mucronatum TaxID=133383 RepID=A0A1R0GZX7_9FUNG|nr:hypothetical protein AYI68_g3424 [Smittium mucronatum]
MSEKHTIRFKSSSTSINITIQISLKSLYSTFWFTAAATVWIILSLINTSIVSSKCRLGSCRPTCLVFSCSAVMKLRSPSIEPRTFAASTHASNPSCLDSATSSPPAYSCGSQWLSSRSTTTATALGFNLSKACCVFTSTLDNQHPNPGCEWYHPTTDSPRPVCFNISIIAAWYASSIASTDTPVPLCGIANTSTTLIVYLSTNSPNINPITSIGTPALPKIRFRFQDQKIFNKYYLPGKNYCV